MDSSGLKSVFSVGWLGSALGMGWVTVWDIRKEFRSRDAAPSRRKKRWFRLLVRTLPWRLLLEVLQPLPTGRRHQDHWRDHMSHLDRERLGIAQEELESTADNDFIFETVVVAPDQK